MDTMTRVQILHDAIYISHGKAMNLAIPLSAMGKY